ncbi:MAG: prephenate dehydrogenase/arogenate dehydrogenase family protein [Candidatus Omnitrophica bacterium]|nr:prephenate dehydrogenase/arogenate dehydrogenase family protein [Candidatus Omnitrophota bacterium]
MKLFKKVAIVGVGLIGGSIALAIKKNRLADEVVGVCRSKETLFLARRMKVVDLISRDLDIIKGADLLIMAAPVGVIIGSAPEISRIIGRDCIVTDVGSTKKEIVLKLEKVFPNFVGSHPMAGSEKRGVANASPDIFKGSLCILTPTRNTKGSALLKISKFWARLGSRVAVITPSAHDKILSLVSHLPHLAAFCLIDIIPDDFLKFGSNGLKDTTRIASSEAEVWKDIFISNRQPILEAIERFQKRLSAVRSALRKKDLKFLEKVLVGAKKKRDSLK